jgi:hypothetical protein
MSHRINVNFYFGSTSKTACINVGRIPIKGDYLNFENRTVEVTRVILQSVENHNNFESLVESAVVYVSPPQY